MVTRINPTFVNEPRSFLGKTITELKLDLGVNVGNSFGPNGAMYKVLQSVSEMATIVMYSSFPTSGTNNGQTIDIFVEGEFPTAKYDGTNDETFVAYLQTVIRALGSTTVDGINFSSATVTAGTVYKHE